jgi:hypothetical protein
VEYVARDLGERGSQAAIITGLSAPCSIHPSSLAQIQRPSLLHVHGRRFGHSVPESRVWEGVPPGPVAQELGGGRRLTPPGW